MQASRHFVRAAPELPARVEVGHHRLQSGLPAPRVLIDRDATAVVADVDVPILLDVDPDVITETRHRLVYRVVYDLCDEVMEAPRIGTADVHAGAPSNGLQAFKDLDILGRVVTLRPRGFRLRLLSRHCSGGLPFLAHGQPLTRAVYLRGYPCSGCAKWDGKRQKCVNISRVFSIAYLAFRKDGSDSQTHARGEEFGDRGGGTPRYGA